MYYYISMNIQDNFEENGIIPEAVSKKMYLEMLLLNQIEKLPLI